ncbi:MAG: hypothetical protein ABJI43_09585 [Roseobacter sp.]
MNTTNQAPSNLPDEIGQVSIVPISQATTQDEMLGCEDDSNL